MSRWLAHAADVETNSNSRPDNPTKGDKSPDLEPNTAFCPLLSGCQVGVQKKETDVLCSIERGNQRHGAIATDTALGATVTYQLIDRLIKAGRITQAKDGVLSIRHEVTNDP